MKKIFFWRGFLRKNKKRTGILGVLFVGFIAAYGWYLFHPSGTSASWWNDSWAYRQSIAISAHTSAETNVYISTTVSNTDTLVTAGKLQSDCGDLRFTKENGDVLPYYIASGCNSASTVVHVYFNTFPAGAQTIYMYYGNPSAQNGFSNTGFSTEASNYTMGSYGSEETVEAPAAYWAFDEGYGATAYDSTSNDHDGTINSSTWMTDDMCVTGKCLKFDGSTSYVNTNTDFSWTVSDSFSMGFWIRPNSVSGSQGIMGKGQAGGYGTSNYEWSWRASNSTINFYYWTTAGANEIVLTSTFSQGTWSQFYMTYDGAGTAKLYKNGKLVDTDSSVTNTLQNRSTPVLIGHSYYSASTNYYFNGSMDDIKIYNYDLSAAQIQANYNSRGSDVAGSAVLGAYQDAYLSDGLSLYYKMDESSWTNNCSTATVTDSSGNGYGAASCPDTTGATGGATGKFANGGLLDGDDDYLTVNNTSNRILPDTTTNAFTISTWINAVDYSSSTGNYRALATNEVYLTSGFRFGTQTGKAGLWASQSGGTFNAIGSTTLTAGTWYLVTATYDGTTAKVYVNGKLDATSTGTFVSNTQALQIGRIGGVEEWDGYMDEFRVYKRALSGEEVASLYNWAPGPVAYYNFEEGEATTVNDGSGNGHTATYTGNGPFWAQGKYGKAGNFNTSNFSYATATDSDDLTFGNGTTDKPFTVSTWVYVPTSSITGGIVAKATAADAGEYYLLISSGSIYFRVVDNSTGAYLGQQATAQPQVGKWTYITGVYDGSGSASGLKIYYNGVLQASSASSNGSYTAMENTTADLRIGRRDTYFTGRQDEVKIYSYERTPSQIVSDMNGGHPNVGSPVGSALGYWRFDEGYGTTTNNSGSGGSAMVATLNNMASPATTNSGWQQAGKIEKALAFDGNNDFVSLTDSNTLSGGITISTWYKTSSVLGTYNTLFNRGSQGSASGFVWFFFDTWTNKLWYQEGNASYCSVKSNANSWTADGKWHHLVASHDSSTNYVTFYKDGQVIGGGSCTWANITNTGEYIGTYNNSSSTTYTVSGFMDEVKLYNYALTSDNVKTDYNQGKSLVLGALSDTSGLTGGSVASNSASAEFCIPGDTATCDAPVGYWNFEEGQGATANDTSGNGNVGSFTTGAAPFWAKGKIGKAGVFDGSATRLAITNTSGLTPTTLSQTAWVYPRSFVSGRPIYNWRNTSNVGGVTAEISNTSGNLACYYYISGGWRNASLSGSYALTQNAWNHVACTYDGTTIRAYKNGKLAASTTYAGSINSPSSPLYMIGKNVQTNVFWDGYIDEVRVYNYGRTPAQIAWEYNQGAPVAHYKLDECEGTVAHDSSGNGNNGTISIGGSGTQTAVGTCQTAGTAWGNGATGKYNASLNFDRTGTDDNISGSLSGSPAPITTRMTVSYWIKPATLGAQQNHIFLGTDAGARIIPYMSSGNEFRCYTSAGSVASGFTLTTGTWYNLACVYDGTTLRAYVNGKEYASGAVSLTLTANNFTIGSDNATFYTSGQIDDVRFYNYALTATQMKQVVNQGAGVRFGPLTGSP